MSNKDQAAQINRAEKTATRSSTSLAKIEDQAKLSSSAEAKQTFQQTRVDPQALHPHDLLRLQRSVGNRAVQRLVASRAIQAKLTVGAAHDPYEEEADAVAGQVMRMSAAPIGNAGPMQRTANEDEEELQAKPLSDTITPLVQRTVQEEELQTKCASAADSFETGEDFENRLNATRGGGTPLPDPVRGFMEPRFGADFSGVRLHTDGESAQLNREVSAQAFTLGQDIYLGEGKRDVESAEGKQLLAHELTHTLQQTNPTTLQRYYYAQSNGEIIWMDGPVPSTVRETGGEYHTPEHGRGPLYEDKPKHTVEGSEKPLQEESKKRQEREELEDALLEAATRESLEQTGSTPPEKRPKTNYPLTFPPVRLQPANPEGLISLGMLPTDLIQYIIAYLPAKDASRLKRVSKFFYQAITDLVARQIARQKKARQLVAIDWDKPRSGNLIFYAEGGNWLVQKGGYYYAILNAHQLPPDLNKLNLYPVTYQPLKKDYQRAQALKEPLGNLGVLITKISDKPLDNPQPPESQLQPILDLQSQARDLAESGKVLEGKQKRYTPRLMPVKEMNYKVQWQQAPKTITGNVDARQMLKSLDIKYQLENKEAKGKEVGIEGESIHKKLFSRGPAHGNEVHVRFQLVYQQGETIGIAPGPKLYFGSGKTQSDSKSKHQKADEIASMLVHSGQINSVTEYNDEAHAHSEQEMIVHLSQNVSLFDHALNKLLQSQKATVVALLIDMNSAPNTVCDKCHPSLSTFLTTTNWKDLVTQHLQESLGKGAPITLNKPPLILRVSANTKFRSQHVTNAIAEAKESYTVIPDAADVHFLERIPYESWF